MLINLARNRHIEGEKLKYQQLHILNNENKINVTYKGNERSLKTKKYESCAY